MFALLYLSGIFGGFFIVKVGSNEKIMGTQESDGRVWRKYESWRPYYVAYKSRDLTSVELSPTPHSIYSNMKGKKIL